MICHKCGHKNDEDADFCESCGKNLKTNISSKTYPGEPIKKEESLSQSTKILIVVCVILVAGLGITAGALMQMNKVEVAVSNNSTNNSLNSTNNSNVNTTQTNQDKIISKSEAIAIANKHAAAYNYTATNIVNYIPGPVNGVSENSYWKVVLKNKNPRDEHVRLYVFIDAVTGKVIRG